MGRDRLRCKRNMGKMSTEKIRTIKSAKSVFEQDCLYSLSDRRCGGSLATTDKQKLFPS